MSVACLMTVNIVVKNLNNTACSMHVSSACIEYDTLYLVISDQSHDIIPTSCTIS